MRSWITGKHLTSVLTKPDIKEQCKGGEDKVVIQCRGAGGSSFGGSLFPVRIPVARILPLFKYLFLRRGPLL